MNQPVFIVWVCTLRSSFLSGKHQQVGLDGVLGAGFGDNSKGAVAGSKFTASIAT